MTVTPEPGLAETSPEIFSLLDINVILFFLFFLKFLNNFLTLNGYTLFLKDILNLPFLFLHYEQKVGFFR